MASNLQSQHFLSTSFLLLFVIFFFNSFSGSDARPGKTLIVSCYSYTSSSSSRLISNPSGFVTIVTEIHSEFNPKPMAIPQLEESLVFPRWIRRRPVDFDSKPQMPASISSFRDRAKDILSVVFALLFGVACGALTSATIYLVWSVFTNRFDFNHSEFAGDYSDSESDDQFSPKKVGYEKIPDSAPPAAPTKEVA